MSKKLYLHVGQYKTGSTSLQIFLNANREQLLKSGTLYPSAMTRDCAHFLLDDQLRTEYRYENYRANLDGLRDELSANDHDTVILSCEAFSGDLDQFHTEQTMYVWRRIAEIFEDYRICPVVYLRRQDEAVESRIIEAIKGRLRYTEINVDRFLASDSALNYYFFLNKLAEAFGQETLIPRLYSRDCLIGGDVIRDFASVCGIDDVSLVFESQRHNRAPGGRYLEFSRRLNAYELEDGAKVKLRRLAWRIFDSNERREPTRILNYAERKKIMAYFFPDNVELLKSYGFERCEDYVKEFFVDSKTDESNCILSDVDVMDVLIAYLEDHDPGAQIDDQS